jgi:hypothetical protein
MSDGASQVVDEAEVSGEERFLERQGSNTTNNASFARNA